MQQHQLDVTFSALADPTRRAILARLIAGEATVMELAQPFDMSQPSISKHLKVLEGAGLISRGRDAQRRPCRLEAQPLAEANQWLERYREIWEGNFTCGSTLCSANCRQLRIHPTCPNRHAAGKRSCRCRWSRRLRLSHIVAKTQQDQL